MQRYRRLACPSQPSDDAIRFRRSSGICAAALPAAGGCTAKGYRSDKNHHPSRRGWRDNYSIRVFDFYLGQHRAVSKKHRNAEARRFRSGLNFRMTLNGSNPADKNVVLKCQRWFDTCVSFLEGGRQQTGAIVILAKAGANNGGPESPDCTREIFSPSNFGSAMNLACLVQRTAVCGGRSMRNV